MVERRVKNTRRYWLFFSYCINKWELTCLQTADSEAVAPHDPATKLLGYTVTLLFENAKDR